MDTKLIIHPNASARLEQVRSKTQDNAREARRGLTGAGAEA